MCRLEIYTQLWTKIRAYQKCEPSWFKRNISQWLLRLRRVHGKAILDNSCTFPDKGRPYFYRMLESAALCLEEHGVVTTAGVVPLLECVTKPESSNLNLVSLTIECGCRRQLPGILADYVLRIDRYLRQACETQAMSPAEVPNSCVLDAVQNIASLATLGLENIDSGE